MESPKKFKTAVLGGTFAHLHKGHKEFLQRGLSISERLVIGVTSDKFAKKIKNQKSTLRLRSGREFKARIQNSELFESFIIRKKNVEDYLNQNAKDRYEIVKIDDMFGTTLDENFRADAIVVSGETLNGAKIINIKRKEKRLPPFEIIVQTPVFAEDRKLISSFRIRKGEIDRGGRLFIKPPWYKDTLFITEELRQKLKKPQGELLKRIKVGDLQKMVVAVGDETVKFFNSLGFTSDISVVDFKVARKNVYTSFRELGFSKTPEFFKVQNPPGTLTPELFSIFKNSFNNNTKPRLIFIEGEEDLSVLPAVLAAPLGWTIYYGQPGTGIVKILVDEKNKAKIHEIVASFNTRGY